MSTESEIPQEILAGLSAAPVGVTTVNATYERAWCFFPPLRQAGVRYELVVENTHPFMWPFVQQGGHREVTLLRWNGARGEHMVIPAELKPKIAQMRDAADIGDVVAQQRLDWMRSTALGIPRDAYCLRERN